jgi:hypothetical protein
MSYKKRKYFVALIPALLQYLSISYKYKTCVGAARKAVDFMIRFTHDKIYYYE